jgi:hypothetical protein
LAYRINSNGSFAAADAGGYVTGSGMDMKLLLLTDLQNLGSASPYASRYASRSAVGSSDTDRTNRAGTTGS